MKNFWRALIKSFSVPIGGEKFTENADGAVTMENYLKIIVSISM